ncbi:hypothetical protein N0V90_001319 [Kalmusia sp. IMI 367209]|nr:hypothetical protein N0V90_001319 [Kalmusia sp. IMI 367209]
MASDDFLANGDGSRNSRSGKKRLLLNAFDMFTPSHLAFGQWRNPHDRSRDKRRDLTYWTDLAKILEKGSFVGYFLADTFGPYDVLWEGSWSDDALREDGAKGIYAEPSLIRTIKHDGKWHVDAPFIVDPSPQRTPLLFQAGTSAAGMHFGATHAEAIFVAGLSPHVVAPRVKAIREKASSLGRDPKSIKIFAMITPIIGTDEADAERKHREALEYASEEGGLAQWSASTGIDVSKFDPDHLLTENDLPREQWQKLQQSSSYNLQYSGDDVPPLTVRNLGKLVAIGGTGAMPKGSPSQVADIFEQWVDIADVDGFNIAYVVSPGSFEDVSELLAPELRRRGLLDEPIERDAPVLTYRERVYGKDQKRLRDDHPGSKYKYETYEKTIQEEDERARVKP